VAKTRSSEFESSESRADGEIGKGISSGVREGGVVDAGKTSREASRAEYHGSRGRSFLRTAEARNCRNAKEIAEKKFPLPPSRVGSIKRERAAPPPCPKLRKTLFSTGGKGEFRDPPEQKSRSLLALPELPRR